MDMREHLVNAMVRDGHDERAADTALGAVIQYLSERTAGLRATGDHQAAVWYHQVLNECR
jgi:hypothetical protein